MRNRSVNRRIAGLSSIDGCTEVKERGWATLPAVCVPRSLKSSNPQIIGNFCSVVDTPKTPINRELYTTLAKGWGRTLYSR